VPVSNALYYLVSVDDPNPDVLDVRLMLGHQIVVTGYGTDWLSQLQISEFDSYRFYWAINTCDVRLLIDARTGEAARPAHEDIATDCACCVPSCWPWRMISWRCVASLYWQACAMKTLP
jgi:hypothetical protein